MVTTVTPSAPLEDGLIMEFTPFAVNLCVIKRQWTVGWLSGISSTWTNEYSTHFSDRVAGSNQLRRGGPGKYFIRPLRIDLLGMLESSACDKLSCITHGVMEARSESHHV